MTRDELILLVDKIKAVEGSGQEIDDMIDLFLKNVPDPHAANYFILKEYDLWSTEEIVYKALSYKPIIL